MSAVSPCPTCGALKPADGPCPACLLRIVLDGPDLSLSRSGPAATVDPKRGALETIAQSINHVPRVLLREIQPGEEPSPVLGPAPADPTLRYRIDGEIGRGGMGAVLKGRDPDLNREVALKVLRDEYRDQPEMVRRFVEEAQIGGQLQHPGVVPIYELGTMADRRPFFSMKLVKGRTLAQILADRRAAGVGGPLAGSSTEGGGAGDAPSADAADQARPTTDVGHLLVIFEAICQTVAYAHARGVIHRDLKPSNVMVGSFGEVQVMDWGLAKVLPRGVVDDPAAGLEREQTVIATARGDTDASRAGSVMGTPAYMSPEQARGEVDLIDERSDVFALGSILCELLTGSPAFTGRTAGEIQAKAARGDLTEALGRLEAVWPAPSLASRSAPDSRPADDLLALCRDCLAPEPAARPRDAGAVAARVAAYRAGVQDRLRRAELAQAAAEARAAEERRKRRWQLGLAASVAGFMLLGAAGLATFASVLEGKNRDLATANAALTRANTDLTLQRSRAEAREQQAIDAVKRFRDAVADNPELKNNPALENLRKTLLKEPLAFFKTLRDQLQADHDTRPEALYRLAGVIHVQAHLNQEIGDPEDALRAHDEGLALYEQLVNRDPSNADYQSGLAITLGCRATNESATGRFDDALASHTRALEIFERLAAENPTVTQFQRELANSHNNIGLLLSATGRPADALASYTRALQIQERLAAENPTVTQFQSLLAMSHNNIGALLTETGRPDDALASYTRAVEIQERLVAENPTVTQFQGDLAGSHNNIGLLLSATGRPDDALASHTRAVEIQERLAAENPTVTQFQRDLASSHNNIGLLLSATGRPDDALASYTRAVEIQERLVAENPTVTQFQSHLARSHLNIGTLHNETGRPDDALTSFTRALEIFERLVAENPTVTQFQGDLASSHNNIGNLLSATGRPDDALASYTRALEILERLAVENPTVTQFQSHLGRIHNNIGLLLHATGRPDDALASHTRALKIQERLAAENPTVTQFQSELARSHHNIGVLLKETGRPDDALASYTRAVEIQERLVAENPTVTQFQRDLALSHNNIGNLLHAAGRPDDALASYTRAVEIQERLAAENPTGTQFQRDLAGSHHNIGVLMEETGRPDDALTSYSRALEILEPLAADNPTVTQFQRDLALSHNNIGVLMKETGRPDDALASYTRALEILERLAREHPENPDHASVLGVTLNNMASIELDARRWIAARAKLTQAITWQKKALAVQPNHPEYRQFLRGHLTNLIQAATALGNDAEAAEAQRALAELAATDPTQAALDARLAAVTGGAAPTDNAERLVLAQRAYDTKRFALAARLWGEALEADPTLAQDRQRQHAYNAACAAALAAAAQGRDAPPPDDAAGAMLRAQAIGWLWAELAIWAERLESATPAQRQAIAQTLAHWQRDPDLASVRGAAIDGLPESEREAWRALWLEVERLREQTEVR
jgi:tetratricopeptide (TPR) repeat protein